MSTASLPPGSKPRKTARVLLFVVVGLLLVALGALGYVQSIDDDDETTASTGSSDTTLPVDETTTTLVPAPVFPPPTLVPETPPPTEPLVTLPSITIPPTTMPTLAPTTVTTALGVPNPQDETSATGALPKTGDSVPLGAVLVITLTGITAANLRRRTAT